MVAKMATTYYRITSQNKKKLKTEAVMVWWFHYAMKGQALVQYDETDFLGIGMVVRFLDGKGFRIWLFRFWDWVWLEEDEGMPAKTRSMIGGSIIDFRRGSEFIVVEWRKGEEIKVSSSILIRYDDWGGLNLDQLVWLW